MNNSEKYKMKAETIQGTVKVVFDESTQVPQEIYDFLNGIDEWKGEIIIMEEKIKTVTEMMEKITKLWGTYEDPEESYYTDVSNEELIKLTLLAHIADNLAYIAYELSKRSHNG